MWKDNAPALVKAIILKSSNPERESIEDVETWPPEKAWFIRDKGKTTQEFVYCWRMRVKRKSKGLGTTFQYFSQWHWKDGKVIDISTE